MTAQLIPEIELRIFTVRGQRVMLDSDLASLYDVPTKALVQQVKRNIDRFPEDFMFQLDLSECATLRSQIVTSNAGRGGRRYAPYAFTEHGVAMLSSVLSGDRAIAVNIEIMRTFIRLRKIAISNKELAHRLDLLESHTENLLQRHNALDTATKNKFKQILDAMRVLMEPPELPKRRPMGFITPSEEPSGPNTSPEKDG